MLTISKSFGKQPEGSVLKNEKNVVNYLRRELSSLPLVGDKQLSLTSEQIMSVVNTVGDYEPDILEALDRAVRGDATLEEQEEQEVEERNDGIQDISAAARGSTDLSFAISVADKLGKDTRFAGVINAVWSAKKVTDDAPLDTRESLLALFGAEGLAAMPVIGTYSEQAAKKKKGIVAVVSSSSNERPHHFLVPDVRNGKAVDVPTDWYHVACDESPIGKPLCNEIDMYEAASGGKGKNEARADLLEAYRKDPAEFTAHKNWLRDQRKRLRSLFHDAVELQQQFARFKELPLVYVAVTKTKGPTPIMIGGKTKAEDGTLVPGIGTAYGIRQFLSFDVGKCVANGGTFEELLKTVQRQVKKQEEQNLKIETSNAYFNVLSAMRSFGKKPDFTAMMAKAMAPDKEGANKTFVRWFGDVYLDMAQCWPSIAGQYEADKEAERAANEKEAREKQERDAEVRKQVAAKIAAKHNETVIVRKTG